MKKNTVVLVYGYGGHEAEMQYLYDSINLSNYNIITVREKNSRLIKINQGNLREDIKIPRLREYYSNTLIGSFMSLIKSSFIFLSLLIKYKKLTFISTGPGFCIPFLIGANLIRSNFLYFENSCRFYMRSYSGIFSNIFASHMFVQNKESKAIYGSAKFCGQLTSKAENSSPKETIEASILVTVGSTLFDELFEQIDLLDSRIRKKILCQTGPSPIQPRVASVIKFVDNIDDYYQYASVVVCHAGAGTVFRLLELDKKIIVVPNLSRIDNHQLDLAQFVRSQNLGFVLDNLNELSISLENISKLEFNKYRPKSFYLENYVESII